MKTFDDILTEAVRANFTKAQEELYDDPWQRSNRDDKFSQMLEMCDTITVNGTSILGKITNHSFEFQGKTRTVFEWRLYLETVYGSIEMFENILQTLYLKDGDDGTFDFDWIIAKITSLYTLAKELIEILNVEQEKLDGETVEL